LEKSTFFHFFKTLLTGAVAEKKTQKTTQNPTSISSFSPLTNNLNIFTEKKDFAYKSVNQKSS